MAEAKPTALDHAIDACGDERADENNILNPTNNRPLSLGTLLGRANNSR
jgi:hypothetical protein